VIITGGSVTAEGGDYGAGIGGGGSFNSGSGAGGTVTISGGRVVAHGSVYAAGIGGGGGYNSGGNGGTVAISGGTVIAQGNGGGADIGPGKTTTTARRTLSPADPFLLLHRPHCRHPQIILNRLAVRWYQASMLTQLLRLQGFRITA